VTDKSVFFLPTRVMSNATVSLRVLTANRAVTVDGLAVLR
jgi:hypothetical protein